MAPDASKTSSGPRYAPHDPTLPKPWKGLVDGNTGYLYFWNPETNATQYERPDAGQLPGPPPLPKHFPLSSVHIQPLPVSSSHELRKRYSHDDNDGRDSNNKGGGKAEVHSSSRNQHGSRGSSHALNIPNGSVSSSGRHNAVLNNYESSTHSSRSSAETYRRQHEITVSGHDVPAPFMTFESTGFPSEILKEVQHAGFTAPTPIQAQTWPIALHGRDIVGIAKTGSGKTLGYLFPGFIHLKGLRNNSRVGPTVLVLSPTRELATQIKDEAVKFGRPSRISCTCLYGGAPKGPQLRDLDRGVDVVVATPGRLNDILEMKRISLRQVSYLVLDEADRMLDMGFEPQIRKIVKEVPARRQTLMYTATWPKEVRKIAGDLLINPVQVNIGDINELVANKAITQYIEVLTPMEKLRRLEQILRSQEPGSKIIIFCTTKRMCDQLARSIDRQFGSAAIHGDKSQKERDWVLNQFRTGRAPILVATDVAARGLDIKDIRVVINYDFPTGVEDYVHRIGRTGRAGATGVAYTFFCDQDSKYASDLIKVLEGADQDIPTELCKMAGRGGRGRLGRQRGSCSVRGWDRGRSNGDRLHDSSFGVKGGRVTMPSSGGWSDRGRNKHESHDSRGGHEVDMHGKYENVHRPGDKVSSRIQSLSPGKGRASRSRSRSRSRSSSHGRGWASRSRSRSRSHGRSWNQGRSRSRSMERFVGAGPQVARKLSPVVRIDVISPTPKLQVDMGLPHPEKHSRSPALHREGVNSFDDGRAPRAYHPMEEEEEGMIPADDDGQL